MLDRLDGGGDAIGGKDRRRRGVDFCRSHAVRFTGRQIIDLLRPQQIGVITFDAGLHQLHDDLRETQALLIRAVGAFLQDLDDVCLDDVSLHDCSPQFKKFVALIDRRDAQGVAAHDVHHQALYHRAILARQMPEEFRIVRIGKPG